MAIIIILQKLDVKKENENFILIDGGGMLMKALA